jgi:hypothetical protein
MNDWHVMEHIHGKNLIYAGWSAVVAFLAPIGWWLAASAFFVVADFITGLWAARVKREMWTSNKMRHSISKCGAYLFVIVCARVFELTLPDFVTEYAEVSRIFTACIAGVEFYSVLENLYKCTGSRVFYILTQFTQKKLKDVTGVDEVGEKK